MDFLSIIGGRKLGGCVSISGAKNSALPLLSATLLAKNEVCIENLPRVVDVKTFLTLLENLGCSISHREELFSGKSDYVCIQSDRLKSTRAIYDIVRKMRASILVLGPLLGRYGHCEVSLPGGCAIGARPVNLHLSALEKMGASIKIEGGYIIANAPKGLRGANINFDKITVTGSENIIMAASMAFGKTHLSNVAKEPEVVQLCTVLAQSGVEISGIGSDELEIVGCEMEGLSLPSARVIPDRIEAGTYLCAGAITNSHIKVDGICREHLGAVISKLEEIGFTLEADNDSLILYPAVRLNPFNLSTTEYPGFPTDMQAQFMALATQCDGVSIIEERLFENRFMHVSELQRMGASIHLRGNTATIQGETKLLGADVMATDLRASSALVLAGLIAEGETNIHRIYHLDRGYERLEEKLGKLGAEISRGSE